MIVRHDTAGANSYNFTFYYSYYFPDSGSLIFQYSMGGWYSTAFISSVDTAQAGLELSGIVATDTTYLLTGEYSRAGTQISKVRTHDTFTSSLILTMSDVRIVKTTKELLSGSLSITVTGRYSGDQFFSYNATLVITGSQSATLTINSKVYAVNLATGVATRTS